MLTGTYTAIVTPFKNGPLDEAALQRVVAAQMRAGVWTASCPLAPPANRQLWIMTNTSIAGSVPESVKQG
jgi:hypothetical protein